VQLDPRLQRLVQATCLLLSHLSGRARRLRHVRHKVQHQLAFNHPRPVHFRVCQVLNLPQDRRLFPLCPSIRVWLDQRLQRLVQVTCLLLSDPSDPARPLRHLRHKVQQQLAFNHLRPVVHFRVCQVGNLPHNRRLFPQCLSIRV
jgi:hypothetical protein